MPSRAQRHGRYCVSSIAVFSGQAPARVFETEARPRNAFALTGVAGEGRILLAACATSEAAWEQPGTGHGLLTHATIEALSKANGESVSFPEVAGEIIRLTRVEAERIGVTQTPVFLGSVQGGLIFPVLKRGDNFVAAFPAVSVQHMSGAFVEFRRARLSTRDRRSMDGRLPRGTQRPSAQGGQRARGA